MHDEFKGFSCHENKYLQWIDVGTFGGRLALGMRGEWDKDSDLSGIAGQIGRKWD